MRAKSGSRRRLRGGRLRARLALQPGCALHTRAATRMRRDELPELHYIAHLSTLPSIQQLGILSHNRAHGIAHVSVAMQEIQDRREGKVIPNGLPLHDYVNLYINARNPMMFKRHSQHEELCVIRVSTRVLDLPDTVIADRNAARDLARFRPSPEGLEAIDAKLVFARDWTHPNDWSQYQRHKGIMCSEVLVPYRVPPEYLDGVYCSCEATRSAVSATSSLAVSSHPYLFFLA